jgi:hypothetical protein
MGTRGEGGLPHIVIKCHEGQTLWGIWVDGTELPVRSVKVALDVMDVPRVTVEMVTDRIEVEVNGEVKIIPVLVESRQREYAGDEDRPVVLDSTTALERLRSIAAQSRPRV